MVQHSIEASLEAGHNLVSPLSHWSHGQQGSLGPYGELVQACYSTTEALSEVLKNFWGLSVKVVFFGVSEKTHYYWRMDDFHVSQLALEAPAPKEQTHISHEQAPPMALLRVSDSACDVLLGRVLGSLATPFSFKRLSPLEGTILNEFSRDVLGCLKKSLIKKTAKATNAPPLHLIWMIQPDPASAQGAGGQSVLADIPVGKIIFTVPPSVLRHSSGRLYPPTETIPDAFFYHVQTALPIYLGSTRVQLADLEQLEAEDLIVLENSQPDRMYLLDPQSGQKVPFQAEIEHQQRITIPYTQEFAVMETQSHSAKQSLWDNLMIEVDASFEPIKLPLKQLKQMTEGLVIEMGDLVHNRIALQVEGKTLAWGELLIVGDKFAVRISQVAVNPGEAEAQSRGASAGALSGEGAPPMLPAAQGAAAEEANMDNFLDKDFDEIADDEEEDW